MSLRKKLNLSASLEDYLEAIHHLQKRNRVARVKDIASRLNITSGSVTGSLKILAEKKLIDYSPYSYITLTEDGLSVAEEVSRRHKVLREFFSGVLKLDQETAEANACRVEHAIDLETVDRLVSFIEFVRSCPRTGEAWIEAFTEFCHHGLDKSKCIKCLDESMESHKPDQQETAPAP